MYIKNFTLAQVIKNFSAFIELEGSLSCSQGSGVEIHSESTECCLQLHTLFLSKSNCNIIGLF
jgi:hypothetical protein